MDKDNIHLFWEVPIIFLALLILTRLQGKKQVSQMTYFDYITGITLGDIAAGAIIDESTSLKRSLMALTLLVGLSILAAYVAEKSRKIRKVTEGEPTIVIKNGKIMEKNLQHMRIDIDNLRMLLRKKGVFTLADVEFGVMETDGSLSILKKFHQQPITKQDLHISGEALPSIEIIVDGELDRSKLKEYGKDEQWLQEKLKEHGFNTIEDVSYMEIRKDGEIYIDKYEDRL